MSDVPPNVARTRAMTPVFCGTSANFAGLGETFYYPYLKATGTHHPKADNFSYFEAPLGWCLFAIDVLPSAAVDILYLPADLVYWSTRPQAQKDKPNQSLRKIDTAPASQDSQSAPSEATKHANRGNGER